MSEPTAVVAESSPALSVVESGASAVLTSSMKQSWNKGEAPKIAEEKPQAESAPAKDQVSSEVEASAEVESESAETEEHSETAPVSETGKDTQVNKQKHDTAKRYEKLIGGYKRLGLTPKQFEEMTDEQLDSYLRGKYTPKAESAPAPKKEVSVERPRQPQTIEEWKESFDADKWEADWLRDHPNATSAQLNFAYADLMVSAKEHFAQVAQQQREFQRDAETKLKEARGRYEDFDAIAPSTVGAIVNDPEIADSVKAMINGSDVFMDMLYVIGSDREGFPNFLKDARTNPNKALVYLAEVQADIRQQLSRDSKSDHVESEADAPPPAKPKTKASPPPDEVGGRAATPPDAEQAAVQSRDFRAVKDVWNRKALGHPKR